MSLTFLEVAIAGNVRYLITGNIVHYPSSHRERINIFPPSEFLGYYRKENEVIEKNDGADT